MNYIVKHIKRIIHWCASLCLITGESEMKNISKGIYYFNLREDAEKIKDSLIGKEINFFGHTVQAEPRIIS